MSRLVVTAIFLFLTALAAIGAVETWADAVSNPDVRAWAIAGYATLKLGIVLAFSFFVFVREPARRPSRDPLAFAACATAVAAVVALERPGESASTGLVVLGDVVTLLFGIWLLAAVLALGRCFGVLPEARGLVTRGPYSVVRHPVYLGELGAAVGLVVAASSLRNIVALSAFIGAQSVRMRLEERALTAEFPEYEAYAARTPRLFPRLPSGHPRKFRPTTAPEATQ